MRELWLRPRVRRYPKRFRWSQTCRVETYQSIIYATNGCWVRSGLHGCSRMARVKRRQIAAACVMIRMLALGSYVGLRLVSGVRVRLVRLGRLKCLSFVMLMRLRTYVVCTVCFGSTAWSRQRWRCSTSWCTVVSSRHTISSI